jgi:amidase
MSDSDLMFREASELAGMVRGGEISARELTEISLARIEELNPRCNAFVQVDAEGALAAADQIAPGDERPFAGVPIAIKNNRAVKGLRFTYGCGLMAENVADFDDYVTRRFRDAGFVIVGSTTLPEYGVLPVSEARVFGPTRNPWDLERTPGGSSGGASAAVAAGMVPVAHGNDGGGSIRIPAACCGLVGLKPSRGRVSIGPRLGDSMLSIDGVLTRTVADTAAILDAIAGYELGDATWAPAPKQSFAQSATEPPGRLRIACTLLPPTDDAVVDPICAAAVDEASGLLRSLGHDVVDFDPPWQSGEIGQLFGAQFAIDVAKWIAYSAAVAGRAPAEEDMEPMSWAIYSMACGINSVQSVEVTVALQAFCRQLVAALAPYDMLLTPSLAQRPLPLGTLDTSAPDPMATFTRSGLFTPFTPIVNATGQPAMSLPLDQGEDGLPVGVQLIARPTGEAALLALAAQVEAARPWADRRAPLALQSAGA